MEGERGAGSYSQLFHLLHAHRHTAGLLGDKPAQWQRKANAQQDKIKLLNTVRTGEEKEKRPQLSREYDSIKKARSFKGQGKFRVKSRRNMLVNSIPTQI